MVVRLFRSIGFLALQLAITLALLEGVCRIFDPIGISYYPETARFLDTMIHEEPIGYRNRPGLEGTYYGAPVRINSLGMRDREIPAKEAGEFRVLVMGDSVPFGIGVRFEDSIPHQIEQILNGSAEPGRSYRTLNMGVPSYNTEQEMIQLRDLGLSLAPDLAILIFSQNDIEQKKWVFEKRSAWYADLAQRSYGISLVFVLVRELRAALGRPPELIAVGEYRADSPRWQNVARSLSEIHRLCAERGTPLVVFTRLGRTANEFRLLDDLGRREGFAVADLSLSSDPRWKDRKPVEFANSRVDNHPNAEGSHAFAVLFSEYLTRAGLLDRDRRPSAPQAREELP
jgi:hypothetical protein